MRRRLRGLRFRVERHPLGPRVYFLGARWHDWHLGLLVLLALAVGTLVGLVHDGLPAALALLAGLWLIAKDWRDLTSHRRDTAAWRLGLHRRPHPLRRFRKADPLPLLIALAAATIATVDLLSALTPNVGWRGHLLLHLEGVQELQVFHALAVPVAVVLFINAYYLYRRRSRALQLAVVLLLALGLFNVFKGFDFEEAAGDLAVAALLWWGRASFHVEHDPPSRRAAFLRAPIVALGGLLTSFAVVTLAARHAAMGQVLRETIDLLLWRPGPIAFHDELGGLDLAVGLLGIGTLVAVAYLVFRPLAAPRDLPDPAARARTRTRARARRRHARLFQVTSGQALPVYTRPERLSRLPHRERRPRCLRRAGRTRAGAPQASRRAGRVRRAARAADRRARGRCEDEAVIRAGRSSQLYMGDEAFVETGSFNLEGRAIRKVRQSVTRLEKAGYRSTLVPVASLGEGELVEIRARADAWLGEAEERGFAMALDPPRAEHADTLLCLAHDADGVLRGLLHFVPSFGRSAVSLSMMRRDRNTPNGLSEFLIVKALEAFRAQGVAEVSLNFAAFARLLHSPRGGVERVLGRLLIHADSFFQIERLYRFNEKFSPRWEARYLMHEGVINLPRTALATLWIEGQLPRPRFPRGRAARARSVARMVRSSHTTGGLDED